MNTVDFECIANLVKAGSGILLGKDKGYLVESRLPPVAHKHGFRTVEDLVAALRGSRRDVLAPDVIDAMTTNESFFFRDSRPFDLFKTKVLPELMQRRQSSRRLNIWCAAASTGQEPYSLAMILQEEAAKLAGWQCQILGTDISAEALARAKCGVYSQFEVQRGLSIQRLVAHFDKKDQAWQVKPEIKAKVQYRYFNLMLNAQALGKFDIVFCRNVLIYFDQPTKGRVLNSIASAMREDGVLFLGGAETVFGVTDTFKAVPGQHGTYAIAAPAVAAA
jgi:chemotaxis protein methyltransferase CheR